MCLCHCELFKISKNGMSIFDRMSSIFTVNVVKWNYIFSPSCCAFSLTLLSLRFLTFLYSSPVHVPCVVLLYTRFWQIYHSLFPTCPGVLLWASSSPPFGEIHFINVIFIIFLVLSPIPHRSYKNTNQSAPKKLLLIEKLSFSIISPMIEPF